MKRNKPPKLGPTGDFPLGKLNEDDEGGLMIAIGLENGEVIVDFGKPIIWIGFPPAQAEEFAKLILKRAAEARKEQN